MTQEQLREYIHEALRAWHKLDAAGAALPAALLLVRRRMQEGSEGQAVDAQQATKALIQETLQALAARDEGAANVLRQRFIENKTLYNVGNQLNVSQYTVSRMQQAALAAAASVLWEKEQAAREERQARIEALLPPPTYSRLFGLDDAQTTLLQKLQPSQPPWVVAVAGIGGIGKTALADAVTRALVRQPAFDDVLWLRIERTGEAASGPALVKHVIDRMAERLMGDYVADTCERRLVQIRRRLAATPHLVVIDNLETKEGLSELGAHLKELADPGKFLLTTRVRPQSALFTQSLNELGFEDAAALLQHHAQEAGISFMTQATAGDLEDIYTVTGGNPLALRLVVSLLDVLPLPRVLEGLEESKPGPIEDLYLNIYWQSWRTLGEDARRLLKAMPLVAESGATLDYLQALSGLDEEQLWPALHELRQRSLLEVRGSLHEKRYGIHRLTDSFLRTEIVHWPEGEGNW
ncbi:MAG TPA: NB-ARC domain-containing protein [Candidatus Sulfomarinibacteraceae bacterium]|nr:NB-ARC domain-containing protein [Candidatus Sulfomarinibacteraceae bacterium]